MQVFVIDIDGTVCNSRHRIDAISAKYNINESKWTIKQVEEFTSSELIKHDEVLPGAEIVEQLARRCNAKLIFLTGRSEHARRCTRIWLNDKLNISESVSLIMRPEDDLRTTAICKEDMFKKCVLDINSGYDFVFLEDDEDLLLRYSKYGLALKAPECWSVIRFLMEGKDERFGLDD